MEVKDAEFVRSYDSRYRNGYMDAWPNTKKRRVRKYLASLGLPPRGMALDFGCGKGEFTSILKSVLPDWEIYGTDISEVALEMAQQRIRGCHFVKAAEVENNQMRFDLVFSHHVIEHVPELAPVFSDFNRIVADHGHMVHILPTRCESTLEHWVAASAEDGIDATLGNRYFYEHSGHLRRLSVAEFTDCCSPYGFRLKASAFANKVFGTLEWISRTDSTFIANMFSIRRVKKSYLKFAFAFLRFAFLISALLRSASVNLSKAYRKRNKSKRKYLLFLVYLCLYPFSLIIDKAIFALAALEWQIYRKSGSEMYLVFQRSPAQE